MCYHFWLMSLIGIPLLTLQCMKLSPFLVTFGLDKYLSSWYKLKMISSSNLTIHFSLLKRKLLIQLKLARSFNPTVLYVSSTCKVRTFWETHKIWKNLPHGFDKSADLLSKCQNHEEDFFKLCVLLKKSEL